MSRAGKLGSLLLGLGAVAVATVALGVVIVHDSGNGKKKKPKNKRRVRFAEKKESKEELCLAVWTYMGSMKGLPFEGELLEHVMEFLSFQDLIRAKGVDPSWTNFVHEFLSQNSFHLHHCALQGFGPNKQAQGEVWFQLSGGKAFSELGKASPSGLSKFEQLVSQESLFSHDIMKDVVRTNRHHYMFDSKELADDALRQVLVAYSNYDPDVGYCQGMNYVASFLCTMQSPEKAFWTLTALLKKKKYDMRTFYTHTLPGWHFFKFAFEHYLILYLPRLQQHFYHVDFSLDMLSEWFLTLFTHTKIPYEISLRIMDLFIADGNTALYKIGLALLVSLEDDLIKMDFETLFTRLKVFPEISPDALMEISTRFDAVTNSSLNKLRADNI